jgi:hypothetical protein
VPTCLLFNCSAVVDYRVVNFPVLMAGHLPAPTLRAPHPLPAPPVKQLFAHVLFVLMTDQLTNPL